MTVEQRIDRERTLTDQRAERSSGLRTPTYRDTVHYRDDYGTTMGDEQYGAAEDNRLEYEKQMAAARKSLSDARSQADSLYAQNKGKIDSTEFPGQGLPGYESFYKNWMAENTTPIYIYNGSNHEATYYLTHADASKLINTYHDAGGSIYAFKDGHIIDNQGYGKELHEPLGEYNANRDQALQSAYQKASGIYNDQANAFEIEKNSAYGVLNSDYSNALGMISSAGSNLQKIEKARTTQLNTIRTKYSDRLKNIGGAIASLVQNNGTE